MLLIYFFLFSFSQKDGKNFSTKLKQIHSVQTPLNVIETVRNDALSWHNIRSFEFIQLGFNSWGQFSRRLILFQQLFVMDMDEKKLQTAEKKRLQFPPAMIKWQNLSLLLINIRRSEFTWNHNVLMHTKHFSYTTYCNYANYFFWHFKTIAKKNMIKLAQGIQI